MFATVKFINEVKQRPVIYDLQSKDYSNPQMKANCWSEIGEALYENWTTMTTQEKKENGRILVKRWKALRDNFVRDYKLFRQTETGVAASKKKKYIFFDQLKFLIPYLKENKNALFPEKHGQTECYDDYRQHSDQTKCPDGESCQSVQSGNRHDRDNRREAVGETVVTADETLIGNLSENMSSQKLGIYVKHKYFVLTCVPTMDNLPQSVCQEITHKITQAFKELAASIQYPYNPSSQQSCYSSPAISDPSVSVFDTITDDKGTEIVYNWEDIDETDLWPG